MHTDEEQEDSGLDPVADAVWRALLDAELNNCYWDQLGRRYYDREKKAKVFLALMSSSAVASWGIWQEIEFAWKLLSSAAAVLAVALPIVNWSRKIETMSLLRGNWQQLSVEYEKLWLDLESGKAPGEVRRDYDALREKEVEVDKASTNLPMDSTLINECYQSVLASRGLA